MALTIEQALQQGIAAHKEGNLQEAERIYQAILQSQPKHPDANHNLGLLAISVKQIEAALPLFKTALDVNPNIEQFWVSYVDVLVKAKRLKDAKQAIKKAKKKGFDAKKLQALLSQSKGVTDNKVPSQELLNSLLEHYQNGRFNDAEKLATSISHEFPSHNFSWKILGAVFKATGRNSEAEANFRQAIAFKPDYAEAHYNLGVTLQELGRLDDALASYNQAIALKPDLAEAHYNLGNTLKDLGRLDDALASYNQAIALKPDYAEAWNNIFFTLGALKSRQPYGERLALYFQDLPDDQYAQIAKSLLHYRLVRGQANCETAFGEALAILSKVDNTKIENIAFDAARTGIEIKSPGKIIALVHFGRSGTGLIHSLIDNHPDVSTLPSIYFSEYFDRSIWEKIISGGWRKTVDRFMEVYDVLFDAASRVPIARKGKKLTYNIGQKEGMTNLGDDGNEILTTDKALFRAELQRLIDNQRELTAFSFFKLVHMAYDKAIGDAYEKKCIFYHIHNPDTYAQLNFVQSAPDASWIMMVREPLQSCESWIRDSFLKNKYDEIAEKILGSLLEVDNIVYHRQNSVGVRLEDLKEFPEKTIPALCDWMGIEETLSLYEMTAQGKKWLGDPMSPDYSVDGMEAFGKTSVNRKVGSIFSENDQFILRTLFYPFRVRFEYAEADSKQFEADLEAVRPMLDQLFDFESALIGAANAEPGQFVASGSYLYFRSGLIERWNTLNEFGTYPNMIKPMRIHSRASLYPATD